MLVIIIFACLSVKVTACHWTTGNVSEQQVLKSIQQTYCGKDQRNPPETQKRAKVLFLHTSFESSLPYWTL